MPDGPFCPVCNRRQLTLAQVASGCCSSLQCREQKLHEQLNAFRDAAGQQLGISSPERFVPVVIPHRADALIAIEPEQRRSLDERVTELAAACAGTQAAAAD